MPAQSLSDLAKQACSKNVKRIFDIGDCRYDLIRSTLLKIESPEQLRQLELNSPEQLIGHDGEIWLQLIKRNIPGWEFKPHEPLDPKNWYKVYRRLKREDRKELDQGAEKLKAAFANINDEKEQNLAQLKTRKELPRPGISSRQRAVHGYLSGKTGSKGSHALSVIEKIRKEALGSGNMRMAIPTKDLKKHASTVTRAPKGFLEDSRPERRPATNTTPSTHVAHVAAPVPARSQQSARSSDVSFQDREARLRTLTSGGRLPKQDIVPILSLDGPSSPLGNSADVEHRPASQAVRHPVATRPGSSATFLEPHASTGSTLGKPINRPVNRSPGVSSPQPTTKRKAAPSIFVETKRPRPNSSLLKDLF